MKIIETNLSHPHNFTRRSRTTAVVLHHAEAKAASIEDINRWHLARDFNGIGYHYYIRKDGSIYRGRPEWALGAHAQGANDYSIGICCEGSYMTETMPAAQLASLKALIRDIMARYGKLKLLRHKDVGSTDCPGVNFPWEEAQKYNEEDDDMTEKQVREIAKDEICKAREIYDTVDECPAWAKPTVQKLIDRGALKGEEDGLALTWELMRQLVINDRMGVYG